MTTANDTLWKLFRHLIGLSVKRGAHEGDYHALLEGIRTYDIDSIQQGFLGIPVLSQEEESQRLLLLVEESTRLLNRRHPLPPETGRPGVRRPAMSAYVKETRAGDSLSGRGVVLDGPDGYCRNPLQPITQAFRKPIAEAVLLYLVRARAAFFCRPKIQRDYNAALTSLNDLFQAAQLGSRLFYSLLPNHHTNPDLEKGVFIEKALKSTPGNGNPEDSPYFIWGIRFLAEMQRAIILREIGYVEESGRHFRECGRRFFEFYDRWEACPAETRMLAKWIVPPAVLRGLFESSKTHLDTGRFLEALRVQTLCLHFVCSHYSRNVILPPLDPEVTQKKLKTIAGYLDSEARQPMFDRLRVTSLFGNSSSKLPLEWNQAVQSGHLDPLEIAGIMGTRVAPLVASILATMGFTLYTLCRRPQRGPSRKQKGWLDKYCIFHSFWNATNAKKIKAASLGLYCRTLYADRMPTDPNDAVCEDIERAFALQIRGSQGFPFPPGESLDEKEFYKAVLQSATQNISNIVTIPRRNSSLLMRRGYKHRRIWGDLGSRRVPDGLRMSLFGEPDARAQGDLKRREDGLNKLVVLRRWQSFNPRIPRPEGYSIRGGGYFLLWHGKGIVIDPGFDFIQSFYEEGFSLEDIDAIVITHSHPDHDADFATLLTLLKEWNEFHEKTGRGDLAKTGARQWDLLLNESAHKKYASWLQASKVEYGRIIPLPCLRWSKETKDWSDDRMRGRNVVIDLRREYKLAIEIIPAWHDDVIGKTAAVGLKFQLYSKNGLQRLGVVGLTSDTGAYGHNASDAGESGRGSISSQFADCDVLLAHLGDVRLRELSTMMAIRGMPWKTAEKQHPVLALLVEWMKGIPGDAADISGLLARRIKEFMDFATTLDLIPANALELEIKKTDSSGIRVQDWLGHFVSKRGRIAPLDVREGGMGAELIEGLASKQDKTSRLDEAARTGWSWAYERIMADLRTQESDRIAIKLIVFLAASSQLYWQYANHLGVFGIQKLFCAMAEYHKKKKNQERLFIVGELPEELTSYRHVIACWLDRLDPNHPGRRHRKKPVYALTGDIGMHVSLGDGREPVKPKIRCALCTFNNEIICEKGNYHPPSLIKEVSIKRQNSAMLYLCTYRGHFPHPEDAPRFFLLDPERRFH